MTLQISELRRLDREIQRGNEVSASMGRIFDQAATKISSRSISTTSVTDAEGKAQTKCSCRSRLQLRDISDVKANRKKMGRGKRQESLHAP